MNPKTWVLLCLAVVLLCHTACGYSSRFRIREQLKRSSSSGGSSSGGESDCNTECRSDNDCADDECCYKKISWWSWGRCAPLGSAKCPPTTTTSTTTTTESTTQSQCTPGCNPVFQCCNEIASGIFVCNIRSGSGGPCGTGLCPCQDGLTCINDVCLAP